MVMCLSYAPSGDMLAVGDYDGNIHFFNAQGEKLQSPVSGHLNLVYSVAWSPDGTKLASGSADKTVRIWEAATGKELSQLNVGYVLFSLDLVLEFRYKITVKS